MISQIESILFPKSYQMNNIEDRKDDNTINSSITNESQQMKNNFIHFYQSLKSPYKFLKGIGVSFFHFTKPIFGNIFCNIQHFLDFSCRQKRISLEEFRRWYIWEFKSLISWRIFSLDLNIWGTGIDSIHSKHISLHLCYSELMNDEWSHAFGNMYSFVFINDIMIFIVFLLKLFVLIHFCHWKEKREHHSSFILNE